MHTDSAGEARRQCEQCCRPFDNKRRGTWTARDKEDNVVYFCSLFCYQVWEQVENSVIADSNIEIHEDSFMRALMSGPNVYGVTYDGQTRIVIAPSFGDAVELWLQAMREPWGEDWTGDEQPEQVVLISDELVIGVELEVERRRQEEFVARTTIRCATCKKQLVIPSEAIQDANEIEKFCSDECMRWWVSDRLGTGRGQIKDEHRASQQRRVDETRKRLDRIDP